MEENTNVPAQNEIDEATAPETEKPKKRPRKKSAKVEQAAPTASDEATEQTECTQSPAVTSPTQGDEADISEEPINETADPTPEPEVPPTDLIADLRDDDGAIAPISLTARESEAPIYEDTPCEDAPVAESDDEHIPDLEESESEPETVRGYMDIEHFSDYRAARDTEPDEPMSEEEIENTETSEAEVVFGFEDGEIHEYENMTILDELEEPEKERPAKKVREESPDEKKYDPEKPRKVDFRFDILELFVFTLVAIMILTTFFFKHSKVEGDSMNSTLFEGDHLIISDLFYEPERYDIVVCEDYSTGLRKPIVKRVIATEGEHVLVKSLDEVYVNGVLIDSDFVWIDGAERPDFKLLYPIELTVPEGEVFVMGDHRNDSLDSRQLGTIDEDAILGRVLFRFFPFDSFGAVE